MTRTSAAVAVVCALLLAGCSGGKAPTDEAGAKLAGKTESRVVDPSETAGGSAAGDGGGAVDAAPGNGEIRGIVQDDAGIPLADAMVSLLGTQLSERTNVTGHFRFPNVTAGEVTLRVVADLYRVHEGRAEVREGRITEVKITLVPADGRGPGYRPHLHDYWAGRPEVTIMDDDVEWTQTSIYSTTPVVGDVYDGVYTANAGTFWSYFMLPENEDGLPPIVLPGTKAMKVTWTWDDAEVDIDAVNFAFKPASVNQYVAAPAMAKDKEAEFELDPEHADNGHQIFSLWQFRFQPAPRLVPMTVQGPLHVKIVLVRGELPVEDGHEDFWGGNTSMVVRDYNTTLSIGTVGLGTCADQYQTLLLDPKRLVPPGTARMHMRLSWRATQDQLVGTPADGKFMLRWKPANLLPGAPVTDYLTAPPSRDAGTTLEYDVPILSTQTDAFYQKASNWKFNLDRTDIPDDDKTCPTNTEQQHRFNLEVVVHRDPAFE